MSIPMVPRLLTPTTELIEIHPEHANDVFSFTSDEQVAKTAIWDAHQSVDQSRAYIHQVRSRFSRKISDLYLCWAVKELSTEKVVGLISLTQLGGIRAQIGYVFHYQRWNSRLPAESLNAVTAYTLKSFPELERLQCRCFPTNQSSIQLLDKIGYQFEGVNQAMVKVRGKIQDLSCFSMTRKRWEAIQKSPIQENYYEEHI